MDKPKNKIYTDKKKRLNALRTMRNEFRHESHCSEWRHLVDSCHNCFCSGSWPNNEATSVQSLSRASRQLAPKRYPCRFLQARCTPPDDAAFLEVCDIVENEISQTLKWLSERTSECREAHEPRILVERASKVSSAEQSNEWRWWTNGRASGLVFTSLLNVRYIRWR